MKKLRIAVTGHRPSKLGGYSEQVFSRLVALAEAVIRKYQTDDVELEVYTGMALGWDTAIAQACVNLETRFVACVPFKGQESMWPKTSQIKFLYLIEKAAMHIVITSGGFSHDAMQKRNQYMVDRCDVLVALWDGGSGGTGNCVNYAKKNEKEWLNVWQSWMKYK